MNRFLNFVSAMLVFGLIAAPSLVRAQAPKTQTVEFPSGKETASGFLAVPDKPGVYPGLVVIHEWWGLNDWVKEQSEKLAEQGYVVLAVDLYRGKSAADPSDAHELMRGLPNDRALREGRRQSVVARKSRIIGTSATMESWKICAAVPSSG